MERMKKIVLGIDFILVVGSLITLGMIMGYATPLVISPIDGYSSSNGSILFEFENADKIFIDDNLDFTSPQVIYVEDNLVINLNPGVYYWKVVGALESEVRELTIKSEVSLRLRESEEGYEVVNSGNTRLNVEIYNSGKLTEEIILDIDESRNVEGNKFIGRQDE